MAKESIISDILVTDVLVELHVLPVICVLSILKLHMKVQITSLQKGRENYGICKILIFKVF